MFGHEVTKVPWRVPGERGFCEMRILGQEARRFGFEIGEVAAAAAGYANFLGWFFRVIDDLHASPALRRASPTEQASGTTANDEDVNLLQNRSLASNRGKKVLFPPCWRLGEPV
jgi:hypothetical protein